MKNPVRSVKNHVVRHRFKYGVAVGLTAGLYLTYRSSEMHNAFLKEHGLFDKFYEMSE